MVGPHLATRARLYELRRGTSAAILLQPGSRTRGQARVEEQDRTRWGNSEDRLGLVRTGGQTRTSEDRMPE